MIGRECPSCPSILVERTDGDLQCVTCMTVVRIEPDVNDRVEPCPTCGHKPEPKHEARPPSPLTQIGRR